MENLPAIPILQHEPDEVMQEVIKVSNVLKDVVVKAGLSKKFGGEKEHLFYEAWQAVGGFFSHSVKTLDAVPVEIDGVKGARARAVLFNGDGVEVGGADAYCMRDERNWTTKPFFQLASMAQTRAGSKAFRNRFAWVAVIGGYAGTPAEEMDGVHNQEEEVNASESSQITASYIGRFAGVSTLDELKTEWTKVNKSKKDLLPEHFEQLQAIKNQLKEKLQ